MGYFTLQFENREFEEQYQKHQKKSVEKRANYYMIILIFGQCFAILDQFLSKQYYLVMLYCPATTFEAYLVYLIHKHQIKMEYIQMYINLLSLTASTLQLGFYYLDFLNLSEAQSFVYLDIMHQFILLYNFGSSHILSSVLFIYFIIIRVYVQISIGFTFLPFAFALYGLFYIIDLYQKEKQSRKQFLKGQRNKLFEQLIQEFIDDQICIIEKDEENIQFIPVIINNKFKEFQQDINRIIKDIIISQIKQSLYNYLYKTNKDRETLLCHYNNKVYQITYWRIIQKKCQIFVKMQQIYNSKSSIVNYKKLYQKQLNNIKQVQKLILKNNIQISQQGKQLLQQVNSSIFFYWFKKYYCLYKCKIEIITFAYLENQFKKRDINFSKVLTKPIYTDKLLLGILLQLIYQSMLNISVQVFQFKSILDLRFYGDLKIKSLEKVHKVINQILFHIGFGNCSILQNSDSTCLINVKIINYKYSKFQRHSLK